MKNFFTLTLCFLTLSLTAQVEYPYPYNPDSDSDGFIGINDLLDLLSLYSEEYNAGVLATDSTSAIYYTGNMDYWDCTSSCVGLEGNWKVLDHYLIGTYKYDIYNLAMSENITNIFWLDHKEIPDYNGDYRCLKSEDDNGVPLFSHAAEYPYTPHSCICQIRTSFFLEE